MEVMAQVNKRKNPDIKSFQHQSTNIATTFPFVASWGFSSRPRIKASLSVSALHCSPKTCSQDMVRCFTVNHKYITKQTRIVIPIGGSK
jgi:hypothetical protein